MTEFRVDPQEMIATLLALAAERRRPFRMPREAIERAKATKRRRAKERQRAALARRPSRGRWMPTFGDRIQDRMVGRMEPGAWYGAYDMARLAGEKDPKASKSKVTQILWPAGLLERRRLRDPPRAGALLLGPRTVYRLTPRGELLREALTLIGV